MSIEEQPVYSIAPVGWAEDEKIRKDNRKNLKIRKNNEEKITENEN